MANSSANADIAAPLRTAQAAKPQALGNGDDNFKSLFKSWQSFEDNGVPALAAVAEAADQANMTAASKRQMASAAIISRTVSIPSRMPVEGIHLTSSYGMREHPVLGGRRAHKGVDLAGPVGTPIHATADGMISKASWFSSYGLYVSIEHGGDIQTRYAHMSRLNVAAGQRVRKGDIIGFIGSTGRSTGPHLHYEVRVQGKAVNPVPYMQADELVAATTGSSVTGG
ncbi:MAG: M23 family metallopeptidase [Novosphingobium sp.]|nr:M23 family metallopeptidase [Novosphingobium sp.]